MPTSVISGACPGRIPSWPSLPGISTSATVSRSSCRSGVTTTNWMASGSMAILDARLHLLGLLHDFIEAAHGVFDLHVLAFEAGELRGHVHRLGKELLDAPRACHGSLVFVG